MAEPVAEPLADLRVASVAALLPPSCVVEELPGDESLYHFVVDTREQVLDILRRKDDRLLVVIQCSASSAALLQLVQELCKLSDSTREQLLLVIEPDETSAASESYHINQGLREARSLLLKVNRLGMPTAYNFGDTVTPQYFADLLSWASVSAQSEMLRELVSGLSMPAGLRASVSESSSALSALQLCATPHHFLGISSEGLSGIVSSKGNSDAHVVLEAASLPEPKGAVALVEEAMRSVDGTNGASLILDIGEVGAADSFAALMEALTAHVAATSRKAGISGVRVHVTADGLGTGKTLIDSLAKAVKDRRRAATKQASRDTAPVETPDNLRIQGVRPLLPPACLLEEQPRELAHEAVVRRGRAELQHLLRGESSKFLVVVGPSLVGDPAATMEYAARLASLAQEVSDELLVVMRMQLMAEPGAPWAGMVKDPTKDGQFLINKGLRISRDLLLQVNQLGLPTASNFTDTVTPQYFADLLSWASVGAQSETMRQLVSGLSMPAGLRTSAEQLGEAVEAVNKAAQAQHFFGVTSHGIAGIVHATGNPDCTLVLGGIGVTADERAEAVRKVCSANRQTKVVVDCGGPDFPSTSQAEFAAKLAKLVEAGEAGLHGVCLSSYLLSGSNPDGAGTTVRGMSISSPCMDWMQTENAIRAFAAAVRVAAGGSHTSQSNKKQRLNST